VSPPGTFYFPQAPGCPEKRQRTGSGKEAARKQEGSGKEAARKQERSRKEAYRKISILTLPFFRRNPGTGAASQTIYYIQGKIS
jgi:hypothetical protein